MACSNVAPESDVEEYSQLGQRLAVDGGVTSCPKCQSPPSDPEYAPSTGSFVAPSGDKSGAKPGGRCKLPDGCVVIQGGESGGEWLQCFRDNQGGFGNNYGYCFSSGSCALPDVLQDQIIATARTRRRKRRS